MDPEIKSIEIANPEIEYLRETVLELAKNAARIVTTMDKLIDRVLVLEKENEADRKRIEYLEEVVVNRVIK